MEDRVARRRSVSVRHSEDRTSPRPTRSGVQSKHFGRCPRCGYTKDIFQCNHCWVEMCMQCWRDNNMVCPDCGRK